MIDIYLPLYYIFLIPQILVNYSLIRLSSGYCPRMLLVVFGKAFAVTAIVGGTLYLNYYHSYSSRDTTAGLTSAALLFFAGPSILSIVFHYVFWRCLKDAKAIRLRYRLTAPSMFFSVLLLLSTIVAFRMHYLAILLTRIQLSTDEVEAYSSDYFVRESFSLGSALIQQSNLTVKALSTMAKSSNSIIRDAVAANSLTVSTDLELLSTDKVAYVRDKVIANKNTSEATLAVLLQDSEVWFSILRNPAVKGELLQKVLQKISARDIALQSLVASQFLEAVANNSDAEVRGFVASNRNTPCEVVTRLLRDQAVKEQMSWQVFQSSSERCENPAR